MVRELNVSGGGKKVTEGMRYRYGIPSMRDFGQRDEPVGRVGDWNLERKTSRRFVRNGNGNGNYPAMRTGSWRPGGAGVGADETGWWWLSLLFLWILTEGCRSRKRRGSKKDEGLGGRAAPTSAFRSAV